MTCIWTCHFLNDTYFSHKNIRTSVSHDVKKYFRKVYIHPHLTPHTPHSTNPPLHPITNTKFHTIFHPASPPTVTIMVNYQKKYTPTYVRLWTNVLLKTTINIITHIYFSAYTSALAMSVAIMQCCSTWSQNDVGFLCTTYGVFLSVAHLWSHCQIRKALWIHIPIEYLNEHEIRSTCRPIRTYMYNGLI